MSALKWNWAFYLAWVLKQKHANCEKQYSVMKIIGKTNDIISLQCNKIPQCKPITSSSSYLHTAYFAKPNPVVNGKNGSPVII